MRRGSASWWLVVAALAIGILCAIRILAVSEWDPTSLTAFGEDAVAINEYAEAKLGREVWTRDLQGHDGKFFFVQANDPWVLNPEENAALLDRPVYRSQRMLYPVLASAGGMLPADVIVWSLIATNIIALAVGTWAVGQIAQHHGLSVWWGLAFGLNLGLLVELFIDGAGIVAFALACLGALALERGNSGLAAIAFSGAALTREVMLAFVAFIVLFWIVRKRAVPWIVGIAPLLAVATWGLYIRLQIGLESGVAQVREITFIPFSGMIEAMTTGLAQPFDLLVILVVVLLTVTVTVRGWRSDVFVTWGSIGFAFLAPFLTVYVWQKSFDIMRAVAPLITAFLIEFALARRRDSEPAVTS